MSNKRGVNHPCTGVENLMLYVMAVRLSLFDIYFYIVTGGKTIRHKWLGFCSLFCACSLFTLKVRTRNNNPGITTCDISLLFYVPLEKIFFICRRHNCLQRGANLDASMLGTYGPKFKQRNSLLHLTYSDTSPRRLFLDVSEDSPNLVTFTTSRGYCGHPV